MKFVPGKHSGILFPHSNMNHKNDMNVIHDPLLIHL